MGKSSIKSKLKVLKSYSDQNVYGWLGGNKTALIQKYYIICCKAAHNASSEKLKTFTTPPVRVWYKSKYETHEYCPNKL